MMELPQWGGTFRDFGGQKVQIGGDINVKIFTSSSLTKCQFILVQSFIARTDSIPICLRAKYY